jgi:hypothetical protein
LGGDRSALGDLGLRCTIAVVGTVMSSSMTRGRHHEQGTSG